MLANQFQDIESGSAVPLQKFITSGDLTPIPADDADITTAAQIQVWNPDDNDGLGGYDVYWYMESAVNYDKEIWVDVPNVWSANYFAYDPDAVIRFGDAVWFRSPWDADITVAGQVAAGTSAPVVTKKDEWYLIANPFPEALKLNNGKIDWLACGLSTVAGDLADIDTGAQIQYWNPLLNEGDGGYDIYWFMDSAVNYDKGIWVDVPNVWSANYFALDLDAAIPAGQGFWFRQPFGEKTLVFGK